MTSAGVFRCSNGQVDRLSNKPQFSGCMLYLGMYKVTGPLMIFHELTL